MVTCRDPKRLVRSAYALLALSALACSLAQAEEPVQVGDVGSFYVGGESIRLRGLPARPRLQADGTAPQQVNPNGDFESGQVYVQFVKLVRPRQRLPLLLLPGGSLSGVSYETTPDGRPGWQLLFLRMGYSVYIADLLQAGRSPWARVPEVNPQEPQFRSKAFLWEVFRIGPVGSFDARGRYADSRFPIAAFDEFAKQAMPRFHPPEAQLRDSYDALIRRICPCIVVAHSASGLPALAAAQRHADLIAAVVAIEPSGVPAIDKPKPARQLFLWGDHLDLSATEGEWASQYHSAHAYHEAMRSVGGTSTWLHLPALGIRGNSHMLMMDDNSADLAGRVHRWLSAEASSKRRTAR
jgi:pimeloyl-ACP methyl ester carboxylesterase